MQSTTELLKLLVYNSYIIFICNLTVGTVMYAQLLKHLQCVAGNVAQQEGLTEGYRIVINDSSDGG